jgi:hypothetical protein
MARKPAPNSFAALIRESINEIKVLLMFGPFPKPYTHLSDRLDRELKICRSLLKRRRRAKR